MGSADQETGFVHVFERGAGARASLTVLLLHGTGGDERDLLPLGRAIAPGANLLSPRGRVMEGTMPRFFRRLSEGVFDLEDLAVRTDELAHFIRDAADRYGLAESRIVACGLSNGANIAASLLLTEPGLLGGAVLFRPMVPFVPEEPPPMSGTPVLICAGRADPLVPQKNTEQLARLLDDYGADVQLEWILGGHQLSRADLDVASRWMGALT